LNEEHFAKLTRRLGGALSVVARIGSGGMGTVYRAEVRERLPGVEPGETVAVKVLHPHLVSTAAFLDRFRREWTLGRRVVHPNVVRTFAGGEVPRTLIAYLVMEHVEGETLRVRLDREGRYPEATCLAIARSLLEGLTAIHDEGIVHRDLHPGNVIVTGKEVVRIMDLGASLDLDAAVRLSLTGQFVGSVLYAAPEQLERDTPPLDGRADLYALGLVLHELATGRHPYQHDDPRERLRRRFASEPAVSSDLTRETSPVCAAIVERLLARDREARFSSAAEVLAALPSA
jgi:serine/threonine protein kinase